MKKLIVFIMILVTVVSVLAGCKKEHVHSFGEWSTTKNPTCQEDGVKTRYCDCGEKQSDVVPSVEHKYDNNICVYCGSGAESSGCSHKNVENVAGKAPTCTENGLSDGVKCADCGVMLTEQTKLPLVAHTEGVINGKEATCTDKGLTEGIECTVCHTVIEAQKETPIISHTETKIEGYASTCKVAGRSDGVECSACHTVLVAQTELPLAKHTYDDDYDATCNVCGNLRDVACAHATIICIERIDPTCTSKGLTEGMYCEDCGETLLEQQVIDVLPHTPIIVTGINATCYSTGLTDGKTCINCGLLLLAQNVIAKTSHTPGDIVIENEVSATCLKEGSYDEVVYCSVAACQAEISRTSIITEKTVHKYVNGACEICGEGLVAGLYDADGNMIATWNELVNTYGMNVESDYSYSDYMSNNSHPTYILSNNEKLMDGCRLILGDGISKIGNYAFYECDSLLGVVIPSWVDSIGKSAFEGCSLVEEIKLPSEVTDLGSRAFSGCEKLTSIVIPEGFITIKSYMFSGCSSLVDVYIPNSVMYIDDFAFCSCSSLVSLDLPDRLYMLESHVFSECSSLEKIDIPSTVTTIQYEAFYMCDSLKSIRIPASVTNISSRAFYNCASLTEIIVDGNNPNYLSIDGNLYSKDGKTFIQYATGKKDNHFTLPNGVTKVGDYSFAYSKSLMSVELPSTVTDIGYGAFESSKMLMSINIPDGITTIKSSTFSSCVSLFTIEIPSSVTSIEYSSFYNCNSLYKVINKSNVELSFESNHNSNILSNAKVLINKSGAKIYKKITNGEYFETSDGFLFEQKNGKYTLLAYFGGADVVTLPQKINGSEYGIYCMRGVKNVIIPEGVTEIGMYAFRDCSSLVSIHIPASVTSINPNQPLYNCPSLIAITVSEENQNYKSIDGNLYTKDGKTLLQYSAGKKDTVFIIPDGVTCIDYMSLSWSKNLTEVVIPKSVIKIDMDAFYATTNLINVNYIGTAEEWREIEIDQFNDDLNAANIIYNYRLN